ncbi:restriction endonuclease subunit S [Leuconostoc citreum]|uniref:restriction endonuclease subunit S n=1 Tax=Leuconostoc citreum TaxID=33964 RepID=UPI0011BB5BF1|nr:restriction endonuclease subunit S [Leuconostoc citreum]QEA55200.1 restriction endonuclease subunit S [Leuconostoc citreum]
MSKRTPQIRFKGFTDDWEERKFDECFNFPVSTNSLSRALLNYDEGDIQSVHYGDILIKYPAILNVKNDKIPYITDSSFEKYKSNLLENGDLIFADAAEDETVGKAVEVNGLTEENLVAGLHTIVARSKDKKAEFFLGYYINSNTYHRQLLRLIQGSKVSSISKGNLQKTLVSFPKDFEEQQKIGSFFKLLDDTIALHQRKLDLLKEQKKGFLQKMFPKNGARVPELRFSGFADDWEERKLSSMTNYKNGKGHEDKQSTSGKLELINLNSISISGGLKHSGKFIDEADDTLQKDDLVMILSDVGHGDLLGRVALIPENDRFVLNQRVALLRPNITADPQFLFSYINAHQYYFKAQGAGMSQLNISKGSVENFISFVPIIEEQQKIGSFFKQLDETIALHQRKLDLLTEQKKGFLQKMFVS